MKFEEINPFIRYARRIQLTPRNIPVRAYDCRIFLIMNGNLSIQIDGHTVEASQNTLVFIREGIEYRAIASKDVDMSILNFDMSQDGAWRTEESTPVRSSKFREEYIFSKNDISDIACFNSYLILHGCYNFQERIADIINKFCSSHTFRNMQSSAMLKLLLADIAEQSQGRTASQSNTVEQALSYIKENYSRSITNDSIGAFFGYHPNYINSLVLQSTGITLKQHIINTRIEAAKAMLQYGNSTVGDIADKCGFSDSAYFSYRFRNATGLSPQKYRQKYSKII